MPFPTYTTDQVPTGGVEPWGICYDQNGHIWSCDTVAGTILKIQISSQAVIDTIAIPGGDARGCCYDLTTNSVWAVDATAGTVTKINAATDAIVGTYNTGSGPTGLTSDGTRIWICNQNDDTVTVLLAATGALVATVSVGDGPNDITFDGTHIWTANQGGSTITKVTAATQAPVGTYTVGNQPLGIAFDGTDIWVTDGGYTPTFLQSLERITVATGAVANTYALGDDGTLDTFIGMAWDSATGILWMCNGRGGPGNNFIYVIDVSNGTIAATYDGYPSGAPFLVCVAGDTVWASNNNVGFLTELIEDEPPPTPPSTGCFPAWLVINEPGNSSGPTEGWNQRDTATFGIVLKTFDSSALSGGTYNANLVWPPGCTGINQAILLALECNTAVDLVQSNTGGNNGAGGSFATFTIPFSFSNTADNTLIVDIGFDGGTFTAGPVTVTDSQGNIYTKVSGGNPAFQGDFLQSWVCSSCAAGANTVTISIGGLFPFLKFATAIQEYGNTGGLQAQQYGCGPLFGTGSPVNLSVAPGAPALLHLVTSTTLACPGATVGGGGTPSNVWTDQSERLFIDEPMSFSWIARQRGTAKIPLIIGGDDDYMPVIGSQVCVWDITEDDQFEVFSGTIDDFETRWLGTEGYRVVTMTCVSLEQVFDVIRDFPPLLFENQAAGSIVTTLFDYASRSPVTLGTVDAGTTIANFLLSDYPSLSDAFTRLATLSQYVWGVDPQLGSLYFTAPNTAPSPFTLDSEEVLWEQFTLKEERHDYRNRQILKLNSNTAVQSSELFLGTGQSSFTMLRPISQITNAWLTNNTQNSATGTFTGQPSAGDVISFAVPGSGSGFNWSPAGTYVVDQIIIDSNGYAQKCTVPGTSGATEPAWIEIYGEFTTDNTVQWQNQGPAGFSNGDIADYTFVTSLDNTQFGQVLIGTNLAATIQNLADAINSIQFRAGVAVAGVTFSLPTWENPQVNAQSVTGTTFVVVNKPAGAGFITALGKTSTHFSWSRATTQGGVTTFGTNVITFGVRGQTTGGPIFTIVYTPGSDIVTSATPLDAGNHLQIQYLATNAGYIQVEDTAAVIERAHVEVGTGKYQQVSSDDQALTLPQGLQLAQQQLLAYGVIPKTFEFTTFTAGLYVGQVLAISLTSPTNAPALINASWFIQEIQGELVPVFGENGASTRWLPNGGGHFRYTVRCINVSQIGDWIDFWLGLGGGSSGSGSFSGSGALGSSSGSGGYSQAFTTADFPTLTVTHGLNTTKITWALYDASGNWFIPSGFQVVDANTVTVTFGVATNGTIVVIGG